MQDAESRWTDSERGRIIHAAAVLWSRGYLRSTECRQICSATINEFIHTHLPLRSPEPLTEGIADELTSLYEDCEVIKRALSSEAFPGTASLHHRVDALSLADREVRKEWRNGRRPMELKKILSGKIAVDGRTSYAPWPNEVKRGARLSR